ncbi:sensor histidine kinase [Rathayibacter soli]|uniref:sensor histidine kinase n=1 Tax=Rathayibacter soli TaxID=3144168 RepID=UPI0027E40CFC|nr:HAMP domain-containing sensor histidine kinase [Glaciibacter superstes]
MNAFRRLSISARITIGSLIVLIVFGAAAVVGVRMGVAALQHNATVTLLQHDAAPFAETLESHPTQAIGTPGESQDIAIVDPTGAVRLMALPRSLRHRVAELAAVRDKPQEITTSNATYLAFATSTHTPTGTWQVIAVRNEDSNALVLDRLSIALIVGAAVLVVAFGIASWLLSRTALRPVKNMQRQADRLSAKPSDELLPVGPARDELSALALTLNSLIRQLRASADREKQMVSDASHELRTPLAVLQGELELAELDSGDPDALLHDIRSSHGTVLRLSQLAKNLLELSRIEATASTGRTAWRELTDELADAIDRARSLESGSPGESGPAIDFDYAPRDSSDAAVGLSSSDFGRILDNLLGNAVAAIADARAADVGGDASGGHSSPGDAPGGNTSGGDASGGADHASVAASMTRTADLVRLTVEDSGPGMPEDFIPVALDRFTRADASRAAHSGGGLGLAIVNALATSAHGTVSLANVPSGGLRVTIELPVVPGAAPDVAS